MRNLRRNTEPVFFKLYEGEEDVYDENGYLTGLKIPVYSNLKSAMLCVSPNKGNSEVEQFGTALNYDRTMTTADADCEIDENAVLWLDGADTDGPWNYVVKEVSRWKNSAQYAVQAVDVTLYNETQARIEAARSAQNPGLEEEQ